MGKRIVHTTIDCTERGNYDRTITALTDALVKAGCNRRTIISSAERRLDLNGCPMAVILVGDHPDDKNEEITI